MFDDLAVLVGRLHERKCYTKKLKMLKWGREGVGVCVCGWRCKKVGR